MRSVEDPKTQQNPPASKFDFLIDQRLLSTRTLNQAITSARRQGKPVEGVLMGDFKINKADLGQSISRYYQTPFVAFNAGHPAPAQLLSGLSSSFMHNNHWVPLRSEGDTIVIAIDEPDNSRKIDLIRSLFPGRNFEFHAALPDDIDAFINIFTNNDGSENGPSSTVQRSINGTFENGLTKAGVGAMEDNTIVQMVNQIIQEAERHRASDIHFEPYPGRQDTQVRFRVDGHCYLYKTIPYQYRNALVSRIKIMSELDIAERRKPQDGKIDFRKYGNRDIELRVATLPTQGGMEDVVLRLLNAGSLIPLDRIGFSKIVYDRLIEAISMPYGIVLACGPTGSGKTTSLHAALNHINKPELKIWTAEDPVEITQPGLRQVQVKSKIGLDFAAAMRSFLRADPDVIMVGEMRDRETARIGIEASLTGHLVLSTLHTNSAAESITRLLDMGMDSFNFADAILCILAQRLVRVLCDQCKTPYHPTWKEYNQLMREYGHESFVRDTNQDYSEEMVLYRPEGCDHCLHTGYFGRTALAELLVGTDDIKRLIQRRAPLEEVRNQSLKDGLITLRQDGIAKVLDGRCDMREVRRVTIR